MSPLLPDSAILLQIYSHPYNTTSARLVQLLAGPRGKPDQGTDAGEQKIAWWGKKKKKRSELVSNPVLHMVLQTALLAQDGKEGMERGQRGRASAEVLKLTPQLRCSSTKPRKI